MAQKEEEAKPKVDDKGKGKAPAVDGVEDKDAKTESTKEKDGKDGKAPEAEVLSEEDQKLKDELEMLVERLQEPNKDLYKPALEAIKTFIQTATSSMTAVPKPLKFLRPHYQTLETSFESWSAGDEKTLLAEILSVLGMTFSDEDRLDSLKYRLLAPSTDVGVWGHEYIRHLSLEIGQEYQKRLNAEKDYKDITDLAHTLVPFFVKHNAEADAVDLLSDLEMVEQISQFLDKDTYERICLYMISMVPLLTFPDNDNFLRTAHGIYKQYGKLAQAMTLAIRLNDIDLIKHDLDSTEDRALQQQMAFQIARQRIWLPLEDYEDDEQLKECLNNTRLPEHFKSLGKELNLLDPKTTQDIYKTHLESSRTAGLTNVNSAKHNLASAIVNGFVNAGYGTDTLMLVESNDKQSWVWQTKDDGKFSTVASIGLLHQWDLDNGLQTQDNYFQVPDEHVKAGALLAVGIINSGVREESDPAMALLPENLNHSTKEVRVAAIMGLGLAYAGTAKEDVLELLLPYVSDTSLEMQLSAMAALSLGMVFVGTGNNDIIEAIIESFFDPDRERQLKDKWTRFMSLGLALIFFGRQEEVDVVSDTLAAIDHPMSKPTSVLCQVCAWAGTGTVLKLQELLHICNDHVEEDDEDKNSDGLLQSYAVLGLSLVAMGEEVGQEMILRQFGHLMHYGEANIRRAVPLAMGLISPSNPQMKVYDTLSRYTHDNDNDVAVNAIFAMGLLGAGTNNARLAQLLRQLASYYSRDANSLFMVRIAQGLLHMGKGTLSVNPFHSERTVMSRVAAAGLLTVLVAQIDAKSFILDTSHYLLYWLATAMVPRFLVTLGEDLEPVKVNVRVGQAVDVVGQAGKPKTITGWQTQSTPVVLAYGERAELEDEQYFSLSSSMEGLVILRKNPAWQE